MDELDLRFGDRVTIYAESIIDCRLYGRLIGEDTYNPIDFRAPPSGGDDSKGGGGYRSVEKALRAAQPSAGGGRTTWCLLDGEESLRFGRGRELFENPELVFTIDDPECDGMLFLGCHEKENLYLRYGDAARMMLDRIAHDRREGRSGPFENARNRCFEVAREAALLRFAAKTTWYNRCIRPSGPQDVKSAEDLFELCNRLKDELELYDEKRRKIIEFWPEGPYRATFHAEIARLSVMMGSGLDLVHPSVYPDDPLLSLIDGHISMQMGFGQDLKRATRDIERLLVEGDFAFIFRKAVFKAITGRSVHRQSPTSQAVVDTVAERGTSVPGFWRTWPISGRA